MTNLELDLEQRVDETLTRAAQRNEVKIAGIRAVAFTIVSILGTRIFEPRTLWLSLGCTTWAWVILFVHRNRGYRRWVPFATTLFDACSIASFNLIASRGQALSLASTALVSTLLAITGAIRPKRWWIIVTTALSLINMAIAAAVAHLAFPEGLLLCLLIVVAGILGAWLARISRHALESEVHRVVAGRFVSAEVLDAGYRAPLKQLTEARAADATILISDIRAFTAYAETRPPGEVLEFLNEVQGRFAAIVEEHGGRVDKFMGDGMLAVFGVPDALDNHASHAIAAARAIESAATGFGVQIGIGIHSGRIIAGLLGSGSRLELTVIGDTVNIASRLQALTKEKSVTALISDSVVDRASNDANPLVRLGPARLRGRSQEVVVYTLAA